MRWPLRPLALAVLVATCAPQPAPSTNADARAAAMPPLLVFDTDFRFQGALTQGGLAIGQAPEGTLRVSLDGQPLAMSPDRHILVGFGREAAGAVLIEAERADGGKLRQWLRILPREWQIERLPTLRQRNNPDPVFELLRSGEVARLRAARAVRSDLGGWRERFIWPVQGRVSGVYGSQRILGGEPRDPHYGVDIAAWTGTAIVAPASGIVRLAEKFSLEGNLLLIDHGNGLNSVFLHLSRFDVNVGDHVTAGQQVGAVGATGRATGPHLHWAMNWGDVRIDPALLVPRMPDPALAVEIGTAR